MKSILIKDTTREERIRIIHEALWGNIVRKSLTKRLRLTYNNRRDYC